MADKRFEIAVILSAYDKISSVVSSTVGKYSAQMKKMAEMSRQMSESSYAYGRKNLAQGVALAAPLIASAKAFADQQDAYLQMKAEMMQDGDRINQQQLKNLKDFATESVGVYGQTAGEYMKMIRVLRENSIDPKEILGGIGDATEKLAVFFHMAPAGVAQFAARMRQDMGIMPKEMNGMVDLIARLKNAGIGKDGEEAVLEMGEAYSKAGLGAHNLGVTGLQAAKDLGALMGIFIRRGISGQTVGNNFRRIFDGLRDADKLKNMNKAAKEFGLSLNFYDKDHKFKGIANFTAEINKLKGLNTEQIAAVLKPFGGKQGLSTDFLEFLGKEGTTAFNDFQHKLSSQATLAAKVRTIMSGLGRQYEIVRGAMISTAADIGETYLPEMLELAKVISSALKQVSLFVKSHKELVNWIAKTVAYLVVYKVATGSLAIVWGVLTGTFATSIKVIRFLNFGLFALRYHLIYSVWPALVSATTAVWSFTAALLANPVTWIVAGVVALAVAAYLIYKNWNPITKWFSNQWNIIKAQVSGAISVFTLFRDVIVGLGKSLIGAFTFNPKMFTEGVAQAANAVDKIRHGGISKAYNQGYNESMRFSINKNNGAGTDSIKPNTIRPGNTINNHFSPVIQLTGTASPKDGQMIADSLKPHWERWFREQKQNQLRTTY